LRLSPVWRGRGSELKRIDDSLRQVFAKHRLVFWYDADLQWATAFEEFEDASVTKLRVEGTQFGTKVAIHRDLDPLARYLLYFPSERPKDLEDWLLDLRLQGYEYKADRSSLVLQELGLPQDLHDVVLQHMAFFRSGERTRVLAELVTPAEDPRGLRLKMMAVLAGEASADVDALLLRFLREPAFNELLDPVDEAFAAAGLVEAFWREVGTAFGYVSNAPALRDFATVLFRSADPLDSGVSLAAHARVFVQRWKDSHTCGPAYREWATRLEADLHVRTKLDELTDIRTIEGSDTFEAFDRFILSHLCRGFTEGAPGPGLRDSIDLRRKGSFWFRDHEDGYEALDRAVELRGLMTAAELTMESLDSGLTRYVASWHRIDTAYRWFCFHLRRYGQVAVMEPVAQWVEKTYVNNFLLPLADRWSDRVRGATEWASGSLPPQVAFFDTFVRPFVEKGQRVVVVVSDALRYEAAADLTVRLRTENRWSAEIEAVLAALPSYTQLGTAALLPGERREVIPVDGTVLVDGVGSSGTEGRRQILAGALDGRATAIQAQGFLDMNTKTEARALVRDHEVIYVLHNAIDKVGDVAATEVKTPEAVATAFEELSQILRKLANANVNHMVLTADHGFLFQLSEVVEGDDLPYPQAAEWFQKNRRFALGRGVVANASVKVFSAAELDLAGDFEVAFPLALGRFPLRGSGKRYVHGGLSLQEVVVPVVRIHKARVDDTERVEVDLMRVPAKITTGQVSLAFYQDRPVADKILPRTVDVGVFTVDGLPISEVKTLVFDSTDPEPRQRETSLVLTMGRAADDYNNQEVEFRLVETIPGTSQETIYRSHRVKLQKPFASDFDD